MEPRYEIDEEILNETKHCKNYFECMCRNLPRCGEVISGHVNVFCNGKTGEFCFYKLKIDTTNVICMCPVKNEIYRKYKE